MAEHDESRGEEKVRTDPKLKGPHQNDDLTAPAESENDFPAERPVNEGENYTDNEQNPPYDLGGNSPGGATTVTASDTGGKPSPREDSIWRNIFAIYVSSFAVGFGAHYLGQWALAERNRWVVYKYADSGVLYYAAPAKFNNSTELEKILGTDYRWETNAAH